MWHGSSPSATSTDSELDEEAKAKERKQRVRRIRWRKYEQFDHRERSSTDEDPVEAWKRPGNLRMMDPRKLVSKANRLQYSVYEVEKRWAIEHKKKAERANWTIPHKNFKWQLNNIAEKHGLKRGCLHWTIQRKIHNMTEEFVSNLIKEAIEVQKSGKHSQEKFVDIDHLNEALRERRRKEAGKEEEEYKDVEGPVKSWAKEMKGYNICWD